MPLAFLLYGELREIARVSKTLCFADFGGDEGRLSSVYVKDAATAIRLALSFAPNPFETSCTC